MVTPEVRTNFILLSPAVCSPTNEGVLSAVGLRDHSQIAKIRAVRNQIAQLLDLPIFDVSDITVLRNDPARRQALTQRAETLLGNMYGIEGTQREVAAKIDSYAQVADEVIGQLNQNMFSNFAPHFEMVNEVEATNTPIDLILIAFDDAYDPKARFEARRKLILMSLAGAIDQRERELGIESKFARFLDFLNQHVWSPDTKIGQSETALLVSSHDEDSFACTSVEVLTEDELREQPPDPSKKVTVVRRRKFRFQGKDIPIYFTIRQKTEVAKVLKLLRKGHENPAVAVDDEMGLMGVLDSYQDVLAFQEHLTQSTARAGSFMTLEEISDTLNGGPYQGTSVGGSPDVHMLKFFARVGFPGMGSMRVEFILNKNQNYVDMLYRRGVAHDEYEVRRLFDSRVIDLLFPQEIYGISTNYVEGVLIAQIRQRIEDTRTIPFA